MPLPDPIKYVVAETQSGRKVTFGSGPGSYPVPADLAAIVADAAQAPANAVRVKAGDDVAKASAACQPGQVLALRRGDTFPARLPVGSNVVGVIAYGDPSLPPATVGGIDFTAVSGGCTIEDVDVRPIAKDGETGVRYQQPGGSGLTFRRVDVDGFSANFSIHHPATRQAPREQWIRGVLLEACRSTGARAIGGAQYGGQGGYFSNVDTLKVYGGLFDDNGDAAKATIFRHDLYIDFECAGVHVFRNIISRAASYGVQARAPGSVIEQNVFWDCGVLAMVNGATGSVVDNCAVLGHGHVKPWQNGAGGFDCHVGDGTVKGNYVVGPNKPLPAGWYQPKTINVSARPKDANAPWAWDKPTSATLDGNVVRPDATCDLLPFVLKARDAIDLEPLRLAMADAVRAAARR